MPDRHPVEGLLVDPNTEDVRLVLEALENERIANDIHSVSSGTEALDYLHQPGEYTDAARPDLILLDIELPEMDGHQLLEELTGDPELEGIPVIVLTGSDEAKDVARSYHLHANAYVRKPVEPDEFTSVIRSLAYFWFEVVWLPPGDEEKTGRP